MRENNQGEGRLQSNNHHRLANCDKHTGTDAPDARDQNRQPDDGAGNAADEG